MSRVRAALFIGLAAFTLAPTISGSSRHTPADEFDEFECQAEAITSSEAKCISIPCPLQHYTYSSCRAACAARRDCLSFSIDEAGNCLLKDRALVIPVLPSDPLHALEPKACSRTAIDFPWWWLNATGMIGQYRLADIIGCFGERVDAFYCAGLDPANVRKQWPGSIGDYYTRFAEKVYDMKALTRSVDALRYRGMRPVPRSSALQGLHTCPFVKPSRNECVVHVRLGEVFSNDVCNRSADELWRGRPGTGGPWTINEEVGSASVCDRYVRPESYYFGLLNELPKGATGLVIVAKVNTLLDDGRSFSDERNMTGFGHGALGRSRKYISHLRRWLESAAKSRSGSSLHVRWISPEGSGQLGVDCDFEFMSEARFFAPSGGNFGRLIGEVVHERGGRVLGPLGAVLRSGLRSLRNRVESGRPSHSARLPSHSGHITFDRPQAPRRSPNMARAAWWRKATNAFCISKGGNRSHCQDFKGWG